MLPVFILFHTYSKKKILTVLFSLLLEHGLRTTIRRLWIKIEITRAGTSCKSFFHDPSRKKKFNLSNQCSFRYFHDRGQSHTSFLDPALCSGLRFGVTAILNFNSTSIFHLPYLLLASSPFNISRWSIALTYRSCSFFLYQQNGDLGKLLANLPPINSNPTTHEHATA